ncbi:hypothetical protein EW146_g10433 [Bondarzewia mesenterica]|uniref:HNH nuclease domain-containing protein n=1 Tax=Bondarzewia mesenterica TaxID=1095465 RepID=A0A4S4KXB1_9AGAM|nr:hypothetical protein EW146_g10433 [Bondarzewia mesenterica]
MTALPPNNYAPGPWREAYDICLRFERNAGDSQPKRLMCARFLGYMVLEAPAVRGRDNFSNEIKSCANEEALKKLAMLYINHFVAVRAAKGTPTPSTHPSRPSFDNSEKTLKYLLEEAPQNHTTAKAKALIRDGYRCVLTGSYDVTCCDTMPTIGELVTTNDLPITATDAAYIFPESTNVEISGENKGAAKYDFAASVWAVMERFGQVLVAEELNGSAIHRLENVMTMDKTKYFFFDSLRLWLESTVRRIPDRVNSTKLGLRLDIPEFVTFTTPDPVNLPLPSPKYLHLHATCARVAHLSGGAEHIETVFRDMEELPVLMKDGSSADVLSYALARLGIAVH